MAAPFDTGLPCLSIADVILTFCRFVSTTSTVTLNEACAAFPTSSDTIQVTVVVPDRNVEPDGGLQVTSTCH